MSHPDQPRTFPVDCRFGRDAAGWWFCRVCGWRYPIPDAPAPPRRTCPAARETIETRTARLLHALDDLTSDPDVPTRPPEEIAHHVATCQACEHFEGDRCEIFDGCSKKPQFLEVLTNPAIWCQVGWGPRKAL